MSKINDLNKKLYAMKDKLEVKLKQKNNKINK